MTKRIALIAATAAIATVSLSGCGSDAPKDTGKVLSQKEFDGIIQKAGCSDAMQGRSKSGKPKDTYEKLGATNYQFCVTKSNQQVLGFLTKDKGQIEKVLETDAKNSNIPGQTPVVVGANWAIISAPNMKMPEKKDAEAIQKKVADGKVTTMVSK